MAPLRSYRSVALLAAFALLLSAFAPAAAPCAMDEAPAPMPCHEGMGAMAMHGGMPAPDAPAPDAPAPPRTAMTCCTAGVAALAPTVRAEVQHLAVAAVVRPTQVPSHAVAPDASPPRGQPLAFSILYGCFLT